MKPEYQDIIRTVCRIDRMSGIPLAERQGAFGVAIALAFLKGVKPKVEDMARHLGCNRADLDIPFKRLLTNGFFSQRYAAKEDSVLTGHCEDVRWHSASERSRNAWAMIAGLAGGLTGLRDES